MNGKTHKRAETHTKGTSVLSELSLNNGELADGGKDTPTVGQCHVSLSLKRPSHPAPCPSFTCAAYSL